MRSDVLMLIAAAAFLPIVYLGVLYYYRECFTQECNKKRRFLRSMPEIIVLVVSEAAVLRIWYSYTSGKLSGLMLLMLIIMLYGMTILCMTDYWEKVVPNRILLLWMMIWILVMGSYGVRDLNAMMRHMFGVILGLVFCMLSFEACCHYGDVSHRGLCCGSSILWLHPKCSILHTDACQRENDKKGFYTFCAISIRRCCHPIFHWLGG